MKITRDDKYVPVVEEINRILKIGQDMYINNGHEPSTCYNFDETAFTYPSFLKRSGITFIPV